MHPSIMLLDLAAAETDESEAFSAGGAKAFSLQVSFGAITGTLALKARNSANMPWSDVTEINDAMTQPAGSAGDFILDLGNLHSREYLLAYTHDSGTGELKACLQPAYTL